MFELARLLCFRLGREEKGKEHKWTCTCFLVVLASSAVAKEKGNLFLEYRCPNPCCSGSDIFQLIIDGKHKVPFDKRFGKCVFRQGVEHELSCFIFVPSPLMPGVLFAL
jgi:hypothetical protein